MKTPGQAAVAAVIVSAAAGTVWLVSVAGDRELEAPAGDGHDHAAMLAGSGPGRPVRLTAESARRIGVTFAHAESRTLTRDIVTVGRVTYDETRLATVSPKLEGWIEHLHVDFTGAHVRAGDALMDVYSPRLVAAQEELILARRLVGETDAAGGRASDNASDLLSSARRRLEYWDVPEDEIARVERTGEVRKTVELRSPADGIVVEKSVVEGDRITPGMTLYRIADLSRVWLEADVYEKDLSRVRAGLDARITLEAWPGRQFNGTVTYVYPTVSMEARTGSIRVELSNPELDLKPGMYADLTVSVPGGGASLVIPRSAVLGTGERSLVFVAASDGTLEPREVVTGLVAGDDVEVLLGLAEGERVVSSAGFLIDAESNLGSAMAGMSGDAATADTAPTSHVH